MLTRLIAVFAASLALAGGPKETQVELPSLDLASPAVSAPASLAAPLSADDVSLAAQAPTLPVSPALAQAASPAAAVSTGKQAAVSLPSARAVAAAPDQSAESASAAQSERFDLARPAAAGADADAAVSAPSAQVLVDAYQSGTLDRVGATERERRILDNAADRAVREKLAQGHFKVFYLYGGIMGTKMYEAPELPGVLLKTYSSPLGWKGKAWKGYNLAKQRLGGLFAETTIVDNVEVTIEGKKRRLPWALVQEKVKVEDVADFGKRSTQVLLGMLRRGVRDNDRRRPGVEQLDIHRNLGETSDGRLVHFDADFFAAEKTAEEGPERVRDPPVLREAIRAAQLEDLRPGAEAQWAFLDQGTLSAADKEAMIDFSGKVVAAAPADSRAAIDRQIRRVLAIGQRAGYDDAPGVQALVEQILRGKPLAYNKTFFVSGGVDFADGTLLVEIDLVNHEPLSRFLNKEGVPTGKDARPQGASVALAQTLYAVLKGAALRAARDPSIQRVELGGWKVMNAGLADQLRALGFKRIGVEGRPANWRLLVAVRPR